MKKNKLTLAAGILMVIVASFAIVSTIDYAIFLLEIIPEFKLAIEQATIDMESIYFTLMLIGSVVIALAESILYMIWGVKLIKKTNKLIPIRCMKGWIITMLVFSYILAFIHLDLSSGTIGISGLFLAIAILLTCAINSRNVSKVSTSFADNGANINYKTNTIDDNLVNQINNLKKLREENIITEEEYSKLRDKVINDNIISKVDTQDK